MMHYIISMMDNDKLFYYCGDDENGVPGFTQACQKDIYGFAYKHLAYAKLDELKKRFGWIPNRDYFVEEVY